MSWGQLWLPAGVSFFMTVIFMYQAYIAPLPQRIIGYPVIPSIMASCYGIADLLLHIGIDLPKPRVRGQQREEPAAPGEGIGRILRLIR